MLKNTTMIELRIPATVTTLVVTEEKGNKVEVTVSLAIFHLAELNLMQNLVPDIAYLCAKRGR